MPNVLEKLSPFTKTTDTSTDPISSGATNLTLGSGLVATLGLVVNAFTGWLDKLLGPDPSPGARAALAITVIAATAVVFAADILARGYASAHTTPAAPAPAGTNGAAPDLGTLSIPALPAAEESGWRVLDVRGDRVLLVKKGKPAAWHQLCDVLGE